MENIFIRTSEFSDWFVEKHFNDKDLINITDLISIAEDLDSDVEKLQEELKDLKRNLEDNYKLITPEEMYDISDKDFM